MRNAGGERQMEGDRRVLTMLDLIFIAVILIFFAAAFLYVRFCERV